MLGYKSWLDTRWRFLIALAVLLVAVCGTVFTYGEVQNLAPAAAAAGFDEGSKIGQAVTEALEANRTFRGFVWYQWFRQNFSNLATLFAALLGSGSAFSGSGRGVTFSLALPVSRGRWIGARAAIGLSQLFALALLPSLAIALLAPLVGEQYAVVDALVHGVAVFFSASVFFGIALLLSTVFNDVWRPLLLTCLAAIGIGFAGLAMPFAHLYEVMSATGYYTTGSPPWIGLLACAAVTAALVYAAAASIERRDF